MSKEIPFEKSFASHEKAKYWSDKNLLKPNEVMKGTHKKYIFNCDCGHEINISPGNITTGYWCSYCSNNKLCHKEDCRQCFVKSFASHEKAKFWSDKNILKPNQVFKSTGKKYIFNCNICKHEFTNSLNSISTNNYWCPYCVNQKLCDKEKCNICFEKSFASHNKAQYWSYKNILKPNQVFKSTGKKYIFNCNICNHEFILSLNRVSSTNNTWCNYCTNKNLCDKEDCNKCFEKSFASHEKSKYWSIKNQLTSRQVFKNSNIKIIFDCICGHEYLSQLNNVNTGYWCSYCANKKLCDKEDCNKCFEKSFASHEKVKYWNDKNKLKPRQIFKNSHNTITFNCNKNHEFIKRPHDICSKGGWCPYCVNKTEQKLYDHLQPIYFNLQQQYKVDWCKSDTTNKCYPFDFILEEQKIIIELDGLQHFEQVSNWDNPEKVQERDKYKMKQANDNGYSVIRILQEDIFYDTYQWLEELKTNIEKLVSENKVQNIFMCKDNEYSIFDALE
jgi:very-short-patch-repair endonuclease